MTRQRKIDEDLWEDAEEELSSDHVVERFFSQREREAAHEAARKGRPGTRGKRKTQAPAEKDD
jgi:hypothetical protein